MAYPNPIKVIGSLSQVDDMFEYFKGALLDNNNPNLNEYEKWPYYHDFNLADDWFLWSSYMPLPNLPFNRQKFYEWIDYWTDFNGTFQNTSYAFNTINGTKLYTFSEPQSNWPVKAVNDWGKIKSLELGMFGSVGNGGSLTTQSSIGSGTVRSRIPHMTRCSLTYLRYGLTRFDTYGSCHPTVSYQPPPTNPVVNSSARTFNWTNAPGFTTASSYEYSINDGPWITASSKPINIPTNASVNIGNLSLRTKSGGYIQASSTISNTSRYPAPTMYIAVWVVVESSNSYTVYAGNSNMQDLDFSVSISGTVQLQQGQSANSFFYSVSILPGQYYGSYVGFASNLSPLNLNNKINTGNASPSQQPGGEQILLSLNQQIPI